MFSIEQKTKPSFFESVLLVVAIIFIISISISKFGATPHIPIIFSIFLLITYGLLKKVPFADLQSSMSVGASAGMGAVYIFILIGLLISGWIIGGTIPTLLYYGFSFVSPSFFFAIVFIVTGIIGIVIGSSLTTVATVGVAFIGIASALDISIAITAGAIVSGAFFGDKMSPLSDTTTLAVGTVNVDLFEHIKNMGWTTIPAFIITLIFYAALSPSIEVIDTSIINEYKTGLLTTNLVHGYALLPLIILIACTLFKIPAFITLAISAISGIVISYFHASLSLTGLFKVLYSGYVSTVGIESIDELLTRGGVSSMFFTIFLVILSLSMGGLLFALGIIQTLLSKVSTILNSVGSVITGSALTAISINTLVGEQYLSILLTGEAFKEKFRELSLHPKNLSRVMEDAGTVVNPLVPWSVCGLFIASTLEVSTLEYLPYTLFCLICPILTILFGWLNVTLTYTKED